MENDYDKSISGIDALSNLSISATYPARPGHGTAGKRVDLYANSFALNPKKSFAIGRYNVEIAGEQLASKKKKQLFRLLLELPEFAGVATDYASLLVSTRELDVEDGYTVDIPWRTEKEDVALPNARVYRVRIVTPTSLDIKGLIQYLSTTSNNDPIAQQKGEMIQAMNVLMNFHALRSDQVSSIGHNRHFSTLRRGNEHNIQSLGGGLEALRGFFQSVRPATGRLLLNVNVSHSVFLEPGPLISVYKTIGGGDLRRLADKLKSKRVALLHLPEKKTAAGVVIPREKSIHGLARPGEGRELGHPPQVKVYGASPKDVKFWISAEPTDPPQKKKPAGKKSAGNALPSDAYISVFDYFRISKSTITK